MGGDCFPTLLSFLSSAIEDFRDPRQGTNTRYSLHDFTMAAFGCFFFQNPSFLAFQRLMREQRGTDNARTMFAVKQLPTDNQIRTVLDTVDPVLLRPVFRQTFAYLDEQRVLERYRGIGNTLLVPLDGTGYFHSEKIHCPSCTVTHHANGRVSYSHLALMPAVVAPGQSQVIPLEPEFVVPQEDHSRQDCEREAAKRWIREVGAHYSPHALTLLGDDLYSVTPIISLVLEQEMDFIFTAKSSSHKHLYQEIDSLDELAELGELTRKRWTGKRHEFLSYRFLNGLPLTADPRPLMVNWAELTVTNEAGKVIRRFAFVTNHLITTENVEEVVEAGRCRWKIENEDFNTLKTKGYHFEHNFGHGKRYLSQTLLALNVLAFCFHTILEMLDPEVGELRRRLPRRETFFQHIATLTQYLCFASWHALMRFMLKALNEGPQPPPDPNTVIT